MDRFHTNEDGFKEGREPANISRHIHFLLSNNQSSKCPLFKAKIRLR